MARKKKLQTEKKIKAAADCTLPTGMEKKTEYILRQGVQSSSRQKFRLIVTPEFDNKIKWLCLHSDNKEWSGIMYYKVEGTFETGMKFTPLNLLLMDLGSAGFTSYDESPDMASFLCDHPELISEDVQQGLIHSHNVMRALYPLVYQKV